MTFALPTPNNLHEDVTDFNALYDQGINNPSLGAREAGNLPITKFATEIKVNSANTISGIQFFFQASATYDVSTATKVLLWHSQFNAPNRIQVNDLANGGVRFRLTSGSPSTLTDYREWYLGGNDSPFAECIKGQVPFVIDLNAAGKSEVGTYNNTTVNKYAILFNSQHIVDTSGNWNFQGKAYVLGTELGGADIPTFSGTSDFTEAVAFVQGTDYTDKIGNWIRQTGSVIFMDMPFQIGDGTTATSFNDGGLTVVSPSNDTATDPRYQLTDQAMQVHVNMRNFASDSATLSGSYLWGTRATFNLGQNKRSQIILDGTLFKGMGDVNVGRSVSSTNPVTFDNTGTVSVVDNRADLFGALIKSTNGSHALSLKGGTMDIFSVRFESYAGKHAILIDTAGTYGLGDCAFDFSGNGEIELTHTTGTVTINLTGSTPTPTITNTGGGTFVLNYPDRDIVLNNIIAGSRLYIVDTTNNVVLFNEIPAFSPFFGSVTSDGNDISLLIRVRNASGATPYKNFVTTTTLVSAGVNLDISQVEDL